ncbi:MAG: hypothetical protein RLZZ175_1100 [Bacteroidota bacterium]|jgi:WD40 repeat protein
MKLKHILPIFLILITFASFAQNKLETVIQKGHSAAVKAIATSTDGKYFATGSRDKSIIIWDASTGAQIRSLLGHTSTVNGLSWSKDGKYIASSSADNTVKVWLVNSGKLVFSSPEQNKYVTDVAFSPDAKYLILAGYSDSAEVYNTSNWTLITKIATNADQGSGYGISLAFSNDSKLLAIGEDNKTAKIYKTSDFSLLHTIAPAEGWCGGCGTLVEFSADNKYLAKLSHNDTLRLFDVLTGKEKLKFGAEVDKLQGLNFSADGKKLLLVADFVSQYDLTTNKLIQTFKSDTAAGSVNEAIYSIDGNSIITACNKNIALIYNALNGKVIGKLSGILNGQDNGGLDYDPDNYWQSNIAKYLRYKNLIALSKDDKFFITGKIARKAIKWNIASGKPETAFTGHEKAVICFDISVDNKLLVTADASGEAMLWEMETGKKLKTFKGHREPIFDVKLSPDGETVATSSWDGSIILWNLSTGKKISDIDLNNYSGYSIAFLPSSLYLVVAKLDKTLQLIEPDSKNVVRSFLGHTDIVSAVSFGLDKYKMLSASWDGTARIWDISTGIMLQKFKGHEGAIHAAIFTKDDKKVITAGADRIIRIWDANSGKLIQTLEGHQSEITSLKISNDNKLLISYSLDGAIKCWNLEKGVEFYEHLHLGENEWMAHTKDGYFNATTMARSAINFVKGMEVYAPDQFFEEYYRPDLLPSLFKNRGGANKMPSMNDKLNTSPPPIIRTALNVKPDGQTADLRIKIINSGGGIDEIKLSHNGKLLPIDHSKIIFPQEKDSFIVINQSVNLVRGHNKLEVTGYSKGRVESSPVGAAYFAENADNKIVCHVLAIGINKYKNPNLTLNFAHEDAQSFVDSLQKHKGALYTSMKIHTIFDEQATKQNILDTLNALAKHTSSHDVFVFYYAGHGSMSDNKFYFIPSDCPRLFDDGRLSKAAISATEMQEIFKQIKALKQIIIMDACQSGGSVELLAMRGSMEEKALAQLSRSAGIHVLASAGSEQNAKELSTLKHGLFTYVLLDAMSGKADGSPKDGKVTIYELKSYLDDQVPELNNKYSGKLQFPYTFSRGQDFPIVVE